MHVFTQPLCMGQDVTQGQISSAGFISFLMALAQYEVQMVSSRI